MYKAAAALKTFFSGFGLPAYAENTVPDDAELPYITFPQREPEWNRQMTYWCIVYYRHQTSNLDCLQKADEIVRAIGNGIRLPIDGGVVVLWPETPLVQAMAPDEDVRSAYINLSINAYHLPGY